MREFHKLCEMLMKPMGRTGLLCLLCMGLGVLSGPVKAEVQTGVRINPEPVNGRVELSQPPPIRPDTMPVDPHPASRLSVDSALTTNDTMRYEPYNAFPRELDLWNLEGQKFFRTDVVITPDRTGFAYSEITFIPDSRQTLARIYYVAVPPLIDQTERLPSEEVEFGAAQPHTQQEYLERYNADKTLKRRQMLLSVGYDKVHPYEFRTLTIVDWSASGQRLLFKQRSGLLHVGLRTSDILIFDQGHGTVTIYPEIHRVIQNYWTAHANLPYFDELSWDIQPLGWEPGSDSVILLNAWAFDHAEKKFLGLWRYDLDSERTELVTLEEMAPAVAANGWLATPIPQPPPRFLERMRKKHQSELSKEGESAVQSRIQPNPVVPLTR